MIELRHLTTGYADRHLLDDANCTFSRGSLTALIGRNGAGKSTLLRIMAGLQDPLGGTVGIDGKPLLSLRPQERAILLSFVDTSKARIPNLRCRDLVAMGRAPYTNWIGRITQADRQIVVESLKMVGLEDFADRTIDSISDGEYQRVMIARAIAQDTPVILLDEPTSFLDMPNRYELALLLQGLAHKQNKCVVFSTHELDIALTVCDDIALIDSPNLHFGSVGDIVAKGHIERLFQNKSVRFSPTDRRIIVNNSNL